ncbi:MAG: undecaprenyl-diphosphate phosphatase [Flavobacteriales bacterium]
MTELQSVIIAIVEGLTEFLPVSSTGHMIMAEYYMGIQPDPFVKAFTINIQFGAILSVLLLYWRRFFIPEFSFYLKLFIGFIPAAIVGFLLDDPLDQLLGNVWVVAISLVAGGIILLFIDKWLANSNKTEISNKQSFITGVVQCVAMIPGVSRSAATIIGSMAQGINRKTAAEFSFFLAVPTLMAASGYKLLKNYKMFDSGDVQLLAIGNLVAFVVGIIAIKGFIAFIARYGFKVFGWYRIIVGIVLMILLATGSHLHMS